MKRIEIMLVGLMVIALIMKIYHLPGAGILLTAASLSLAFIYALLGVTNFDEISIKRIFQQKLDISINNKDQLLGFVTGMSLSVGVISILFKVQHWPSSNMMLLASMLTLAIISIILARFYVNKKDIKYLNIFQRAIAVICILGVLWFSKSAIV